MATSKILIADDSDLIRASMRALFASRETWTICGEASDGQQVVTMAEELKPDLIVLDLAMPLMTGLRAAAEILKKQPELPIILYTMHESKQIDLEAKKAGIRKVIAKSDSTDILLRSIEELLVQKSSVPALPVVMAEPQPPAEPQISVEQLAEKPADPGTTTEEPAQEN